MEEDMALSKKQLAEILRLREVNVTRGATIPISNTFGNEKIGYSMGCDVDASISLADLSEKEINTMYDIVESIVVARRDKVGNQIIDEVTEALEADDVK
jgi:hypothetical protein